MIDNSPNKQSCNHRKLSNSLKTVIISKSTSLFCNYEVCASGETLSISLVTNSCITLFFLVKLFLFRRKEKAWAFFCYFSCASKKSKEYKKTQNKSLVSCKKKQRQFHKISKGTLKDVPLIYI